MLLGGVVVAALLAGLATADSVRATTTTYAFAWDGQPGGPSGWGTSGLITASDATFGSAPRPAGGFPGQSYVAIIGSERNYFIYLAGPNGTEITAGTTYTGAVSVGLYDPSKPLLWLGTVDDGPGCTTDAISTFTVHEATHLADGTVTRLDLSFDMVCVGGTASLHGELRFDSTRPIGKLVLQEPASGAEVAFGDVLLGSGTARTLTFRNAGSASVTLGQAAMSGAHPADFSVISDSCSGTGLAIGASCQVGVRFTPTQRGIRAAMLTLPTDAPAGSRTTRMTGHGTIATTATISVPASVTYPNPVPISVQITPAPATEDGFYPAVTIAGAPIVNPMPLDASGRGEDLVHYPPGIYSLRAVFGGVGDYAGSQSSLATVTVRSGTTTSLTSSLEPALSTQTITFTARVDGASDIYRTAPAPTAGTLSIRDATTGALLGSKAVTATDRVLAVSTKLAVGSHSIVARYEGSGLFVSSQASRTQTVVLDTAVAASGVTIGWGTFYPIRDGYRDTLSIYGDRAEPISVRIRIYSSATGRVVRSQSIALGTGRYRWAWNGRNADSVLQPAGQYRVEHLLIDTAGNRLTVNRYVNLSHKKLYWVTVTKYLYGEQYAYYADPGNGWVRPGSSSYYRGVRLYSGSSVAGVQYAFSVPSAVAYRNVTFSVLGRSTTWRKALIAIWRPSLGTYLDGENFDAVRTAGPSYGWYGTTTTLTDHRGGGRVRAELLVYPVSGGATTFDISRVKLTYTYGVLK